jgi:hypothetical protein
MASNNQFTQPTAIDEVTAAFPAIVIGKLLPRQMDIPEEFKSRHNAYSKLASEWFTQGVEAIAFNAGIDALTAGRHLQACLGSYEPRHEHKIAGVAYLMSLWGARKVSPSEIGNAADSPEQQPKGE